MATIKIEVVAGAQSTTNTKTVSNPDLVRFIAAYRALNSIAPAVTDAQVITHWSDSVFAAAKALTKRHERFVAENAVTEIGLT